MIPQQPAPTRLGWGFALALLAATLVPAGTAQAQIDSFRSVDGSHRGVGYNNLELEEGVQWSPWSGYSAPYMGSAYGNYYHGNGWSGPLAPGPVNHLAAPAPTAAPYLTTRTYEPGDGYRYPLYYNPATGGYFYHPVRR